MKRCCSSFWTTTSATGIRARSCAPLHSPNSKKRAWSPLTPGSSQKSTGFLTNNTKKTWFEKRKGLYEQARTSSPGLKWKSDNAFGHYLTEQGCKGGEWVCRRRGWVFPPLDQLRAKWLQRFPLTVWRDPTANAWRGERDDDDEGA